MKENIDVEVVQGFGDEWSRFDQSSLTETDLIDVFNSYFAIFPWKELPNDAVGFDLGCGSGRWAKLVAPKVGQLHCIDASSVALEVAKKNLDGQQNCQFHLTSVDAIPLADNSVDFGYSLGVLHHIPDTAAGIKSCTSKLKKGSPFLLYLYYSFDNRPWWFKIVWKISEIGRFSISRMPYKTRYFISQLIAVVIYLPLARLSLILEKNGFNVEAIPLSFYRDKRLYVMRNDALDRFGTKLEKRFNKKEILQMMEDANLEKIVFSEQPPYWCTLGYKK